MIDRETFEEICHEERLKLWTDCDEAIVGIATKRDSYSQPLVVYDRDKLVENFMKKDGMTFDEAEEWVSFNIDLLIVNNTIIFENHIDRNGTDNEHADNDKDDSNNPEESDHDNQIDFTQY